MHTCSKYNRFRHGDGAGQLQGFGSWKASLLWCASYSHDVSTFQEYRLMAREAVWKSLVLLKYDKNQEVRTIPSIGKKCKKEYSLPYN
jgi:hypothetical protein